MSTRDRESELKALEKQMIDAAKNLEFERAAEVRDRLFKLREQLFRGVGHAIAVCGMPGRHRWPRPCKSHAIALDFASGKWAYILVYTMPFGGPKCARPSIQKRSGQAVRLPMEFRFGGKEVYIRRDETTGDVILTPRNKKFGQWLALRDAMLTTCHRKLSMCSMTCAIVVRTPSAISHNYSPEARRQCGVGARRGDAGTPATATPSRGMHFRHHGGRVALQVSDARVRN